MNAPNIAVSSPTQPQPDHAPDRGQSLHEAYALRAAGVDRLIDEKMGYAMECARLRSLVRSSPEQGERCLALIQDLEVKINRLQKTIDLELKGLFYGLQKAPAPSPFMDDLPG